MSYEQRNTAFRFLVVACLLYVNALVSGALFGYSTASFFRFLSLVTIVGTAFSTLIFFTIKKNQASVREMLEEKV